MTDIPGTGTSNYSKKDVSEIPATPLSLVNVSEMKKKKEDPVDSVSTWYNNFHYWIAFGIIISLIFLILTFKYRNFMIFIPLGPIIAVASWHVRKLIKKYEPKPNKYY